MGSKVFLRAFLTTFGHNLTIPLQHTKNDCLAVHVHSSLAGVPHSANQSFVNFNFAREIIFAVNFRHVLPDMMPHAPSRLVSHPKLALQFFGGNTVAGRGEQINGIEPKLERSAGVFKRSASGRMDMMPAPLASKSAGRGHARPAGFLGAFRANMALTKAALKNVLQASFIGRKLLEKFPYRYAVFVIVIFSCPKN